MWFQYGLQYLFINSGCSSEQNKKCITASSCNLNDYQYFQIINKRPKLVNIFTDNDTSGYKSALTSKKLFWLNGINCKIYASTIAKDAAEHFFEKNSNWNYVNEINITKDMLIRENNDIDFLKYLQNREF